MLDGLNNILALLLREPDRGMAREFLSANRVLLAELERIAPATDGFGDTHPKAVLKAVLEYYGRHQSLPDERALYDYSQTIPHLNDDLGRGQKIRDQLEELKEWQPTMADPAVLPGFALNEARNMYWRRQFEFCAATCVAPQDVATEHGKKHTLLGADDALAFLKSRRIKDVNLKPEAEVAGEYGLGADALDEGAKVMGLDDVVAEQVEWIWPNRLLKNRGNIFTGSADCGKSTGALYVAARVTTGEDWPDGEKNPLGPRSVLICNSEDGHGDTIKPRLLAMGADPKRVVMFRHIDDLEEGKPVRRNLNLSKDIAMLERAVAECPDLALIIFDPITSYFGIGLNKDDEVRPLMDALTRFMERSKIAILAILHSNKRSDVDALGKVSGATSTGAAWRSVWEFSEDPDDNELFHMAKVKCNLGDRKTGGMKFRIALAEGQTGTHIDWEGPTSETANTLLKRRKDKAREDPEDGKLVLAKAFLLDKLGGGQKRLCQDLVKEVFDAEGVSRKTLYRAFDELPQVLSDGGRPSYWYVLPQQVRPETARAAVVDDIL